MSTGRTIGCFGDVVFSVSAEAVKTIRSLSVSHSASIQSHKRRLQKPLHEFIAPDADTASFSLRLSQFLGVTPKDDYEKLKSYLLQGIPKPFVLGESRVGDNMWYISKLKNITDRFNINGNAADIDLSVSLTECPKE
ncbi:MAG: phage tail protein [Clostridia bacterium]|nr:phage tail protein [Clostridia bacterium]